MMARLTARERAAYVARNPSRRALVTAARSDEFSDLEGLLAAEFAA